MKLIKCIADRMGHPNPFRTISHFHQNINYSLLSPHLSWILLQLCHLGALRHSISLGNLFLFPDIFRMLPFSQVWTIFYGQPHECYLMIISMPWSMVWKLQMPTRQKVAVIGILTLGALWAITCFYVRRNTADVDIGYAV